LVASTLESDDTIVGGPGVVVQVDETKVGKRKYNRGHRVEGAWVVVGVEMTADRRVFAEVVPDRSEGTIAIVLSRHIAQGSILQTDCWRSYNLSARIFALEHRTVNHSEGFVNRETGVNTNMVEGTNYAIKRAIPNRNRNNAFIEPFLQEFVWRRKHASNQWDALIEALRDVSYE
jgi:transposase-like protein